MASSCERAKEGSVSCFFSSCFFLSMPSKGVRGGEGVGVALGVILSTLFRGPRTVGVCFCCLVFFSFFASVHSRVALGQLVIRVVLMDGVFLLGRDWCVV